MLYVLKNFLRHVTKQTIQTHNRNDHLNALCSQNFLFLGIMFIPSTFRISNVFADIICTARAQTLIHTNSLTFLLADEYGSLALKVSLASNNHAGKIISRFFSKSAFQYFTLLLCSSAWKLDVICLALLCSLAVILHLH